VRVVALHGPQMDVHSDDRRDVGLNRPGHCLGDRMGAVHQHGTVYQDMEIDPHPVARPTCPHGMAVGHPWDLLGDSHNRLQVHHGSVAWRRGRDGLWPIPDLSGDVMPGVMTVMATAQPPISATGGQLPAGYGKSHAKTRSSFLAGKLPTACVHATGGRAYGHCVAEADTVSAHSLSVGKGRITRPAWQACDARWQGICRTGGAACSR
jgi:hypothetical protein